MIFSDKHPLIVKENEEYNVKLANEIKIDDEIPVISKLPTLYEDIKFNLIDLFKDKKLNIRVKVKNGSWRDYKKYISKKYLGVKVSNFLYWDYLPLDKYLLIRDKLNFDESNLYLVTGRGHSISKVSALIELNREFARLIGYYLSEGSITKDKSIRVRFTINQEEKEFQQDLEEILKKLNLNYSIYDDKNSNSRTIKVSNQLFGKLLEYLEVGKNSYDVNIPDKIMFNNEKVKKEVLKGIFRGDGGFSYPRKISYFTSSKKLFQQIILLLKNFDIIPHIQKREGLLEIYSLEDLKKCRDFFLDNRKRRLLEAINNTKTSIKSKNHQKADGLFIVKIKEIEKFEKEESIYSLEVKNIHNYITTNGIITHNCIGVDPYYLTHKAQEIGYNPEIILAGRRLNDNMGIYVANRVIKLMIKKSHTIKGSRILILGITFKENCPDIRNSRVIDVIREFQEFGCIVDIYDPWADPKEVKEEYQLELKEELKLENYDAIVLAVAHNEFKEIEKEIKNLKLKLQTIIYDIKSFFDENLIDGRL